jgi:integrase
MVRCTAEADVKLRTRNWLFSCQRAGLQECHFTAVTTNSDQPGCAASSASHLHPRNVLRTLHMILKAAKAHRVRFHDLRRSAASLLIAEGVELAEVSMHSATLSCGSRRTCTAIFREHSGSG